MVVVVAAGEVPGDPTLLLLAAESPARRESGTEMPIEAARIKMPTLTKSQRILL